MCRVTAVLDRPVDTFLLSFLIVVCSIVLCSVAGECPQDIQSKAYGCYTDYSIQFLNMQNSRRKLCCGVDVETLRLFCSSYISAMQCLQELKKECPTESHNLIDHTKANIKGAEKGLTDLCTYSQLYETYARHQRCFEKEASHSEHCLAPVNTNIRLLTTVSRNSIDELCRDMNNAMNCIKPNIQARCGVEAGKMVEALIKPMVKDSSKCNYEVVRIESTEKPSQHHRSHSASSTGDHSKYITDNRNNAISQSYLSSVIASCIVLTMALWS